MAEDQSVEDINMKEDLEALKETAKEKLAAFNGDNKVTNGHDESSNGKDESSKEETAENTEEELTADDSEEEIEAEEASIEDEEEDVQEVKDDSSDSDVMEVDQEDPLQASEKAEEEKKGSSLTSTEVRKPQVSFEN